MEKKIKSFTAELQCQRCFRLCHLKGHITGATGWDVYRNHNSVLSHCPVPPWVPSQPQAVSQLSCAAGVLGTNSAWFCSSEISQSLLSVSAGDKFWRHWALSYDFFFLGFKDAAAANDRQLSSLPAASACAGFHSLWVSRVSLPADTMPIICLCLDHSQLLLLGVCMCVFILQQTWKTVSPLLLNYSPAPCHPSPSTAAVFTIMCWEGLIGPSGFVHFLSLFLLCSADRILPIALFSTSLIPSYAH